MFKKNNGIKKALKILLIMLFFTINVFAKVPHSYITENPSKEVTQTETLKKYKEKAELNISVTKLNSKEIEGFHNPEQKKIYFSLNNIEHGIQPEDKIYLSEELQEVPSISTTNGRRKINGMLNQKILKEGALEYTVITKKDTTEIEINYEKAPKEIYIGILDKQYKIKNILKNIKLLKKQVKTNETYINATIRSQYGGEFFEATPTVDFTENPNIITKPVDSKYWLGNNIAFYSYLGNEDYEMILSKYISVGKTDQDELKEFGINGEIDTGLSGMDFPKKIYKLSNDLIIETSQKYCKYWVEGQTFNQLLIRFIKYPKNQEFSFTISMQKYDSSPDPDRKIKNIIHYHFIPEPEIFKGVSNLILDKTYNQEYINFTTFNVDNPKPISLEKTVQGVKLIPISGYGLLQILPYSGDEIEINGNRFPLPYLFDEKIIKLSEMTLSFNFDNKSYLPQIKINDYNPIKSQQLVFKIIRGKKIVSEHIMNINFKNQKLEGESDLTIDDTYKNNYMTIKGCTLENPQNISFASSVTGAEINQFSGKGLLKFEQGDILEINGVQTTVNSSGGISERNINLSGINTYYKAENGNFQIRIDDYKIDQESPQILNMKLLRNGKEIMIHKMKIFVPKITIDNNKTNVKIRDEYKGETFNVTSLPYNVKGIEYLSGNDKVIVYTPGHYRSGMSSYYFNYLKINGITVAKTKAHKIYPRILDLKGVTVEVKENSDLIIALKNYERKISKPFELNIESSSVHIIPGHDYGGSHEGHNGSGSPDKHYNYISKQNIVFYYVPSKVVGNSTLEVKEYYPSPEYIAFNSCTTPAPAPIELENSLRDVKIIQNSGNGLVNLEAKDILELNGKQYTIGTGGNLQEQQDTLGNINFKFKVENGKLRLALKSWGVLEPDRLLTINASREGNPIMEHKMTIKAPRKIEGTSTLTFNEKYQIRDIVKFKGISLPAPTKGGIEKPAPMGVTYKTNEGYGIPIMQEGDILEIQNNQTRGIQKYIIDSKNSLKQQIIDLPGTNLSLFVTNGKLRLGLNNWLVNKNTVLNFKIIRGVNEISNTSITLEVPKAPFDILKNGILDFGKLIQGSKNKKAETNILLEMHQDISNVKFSLSTTTPELINSNGATLCARDLQAGVHKQGKNKYLVKIIGKLDVPEKQELGIYRGSVLLNVIIK